MTYREQHKEKLVWLKKMGLPPMPYDLFIESELAGRDEDLERLGKGYRGVESQLCRIASHIGRDASNAPDDDPTIAGACIDEFITRERKMDKYEPALDGAGVHIYRIENKAKRYLYMKKEE